VQFRIRFLGIIASATGASLVIQALAFLRQMLIAAYFGISRELDVYVIAYSVATIAVFTFASIFDSVAVPRLVRLREKEGEGAARSLARAIFGLSLGFSVAASLILLAAAPLLAPIVATGFSPGDRAELGRLIWYFLPWTLVCLPYYAVVAWQKAQWKFNQVFSAEIVIVIVSIGCLSLWHDDITALPLAYAAGYLVGFAQLSVGAKILPKMPRRNTSIRPFVRNVGELYLANQTGGLTTVVDRHIQSFVPPGGVAAVNYSNQFVNGLATLLAFREIFIVPLSHEAGRKEKLDRLIGGMVVIAIPLSGLVMCFAPDIVHLLFERGRFDAAATVVTAEILRINAMSVVIAAVNAPLIRMFQILDRIHLINWVYAAVAISSLLFGYLFVVLLDQGVQAVAWMQVFASTIGVTVTCYLVSRCGIELGWSRILGHMGFALAVTAPAYIAAVVVSAPFGSAWLRLATGGSAYGLIVCSFYFIARTRLRGIVFGAASTET
jgi:putative peptidoglycan lipid II flippase